MGIRVLAPTTPIRSTAGASLLHIGLPPTFLRNNSKDEKCLNGPDLTFLLWARKILIPNLTN